MLIFNLVMSIIEIFLGVLVGFWLIKHINELSKKGRDFVYWIFPIYGVMLAIVFVIVGTLALLQLGGIIPEVLNLSMND